MCKYGYFKIKEEKFIYCDSEKYGGPDCKKCGYELLDSGNTIYMPDIFYISYMKMEIDKLFKNYFESFEFGVYYFSRGINMINNQEIKSKLKEHENLLKDILNIINISKDEEINKKVAELKDRYKFK